VYKDPALPRSLISLLLISRISYLDLVLLIKQQFLVIAMAQYQNPASYSPFPPPSQPQYYNQPPQSSSYGPQQVASQGKENTVE
jgi:hypothetical protein